ETLFYKNLLNLAALRPRLGSDQGHSEHLLRKLLRLFRSLRELDSPALTTSARMDLRLDDDSSSELVSNLTRLFLAVGDLGARDPNAVTRKDLLGLVLMYLHRTRSPRANWLIYRLPEEAVNGWGRRRLSLLFFRIKIAAMAALAAVVLLANLFQQHPGGMQL